MHLKELRIMKIVIFKSSIVSLVLGAVATIAINLLTASYLTKEFITGSSYVATGSEAISRMINTFGLSGYIMSLIPWYLLLVITIFIGCLITSAWVHKDA